jgi:septation ring formation regulator EzrA
MMTKMKPMVQIALTARRKLRKVKNKIKEQHRQLARRRLPVCFLHDDFSFRKDLSKDVSINLSSLLINI